MTSSKCQCFLTTSYFSFTRWCAHWPTSKSDVGNFTTNACSV